MFILAIGMLFTQIGGTFLATFQGKEQMSFVAGVSVAQNILLLLLALVVIAFHGGVIAFVTASTTGMLLALILNLYWSRRHVRLTRRITRRDIREVMVG